MPQSQRQEVHLDAGPNDAGHRPLGVRAVRLHPRQRERHSGPGGGRHGHGQGRVQTSGDPGEPWLRRGAEPGPKAGELHGAARARVDRQEPQPRRVAAL